MPGSTLGGTIVARATAPGPSGRAVVRVSGAETASVLGLCTALREEEWRDRKRCIERTSIDIGAPAPLPALVAWMPGPRSYTGEDSAELYTAGGVVVDRVIGALLGAHGSVRRAEPGEFTARAFLSGRLGAEEAEGVQALITASSDASFDAARGLLSGTTGQRYRALADELARALALVEAGIDFTEEEDVVPLSPAELVGVLDQARAELSGLIGPDSARESVRDRPRIVLAGRPSTGKSTLFNALLGRPRAVVDAVPGTTRDALVEPLALDDGSLIELVDIAGLDDALTSAVDRASQQAARDTLESAHAVVWCDPTGHFESSGDALASLFPRSAPVVRVRTKADLAQGTGGLGVCAPEGQGLASLRRALRDAASGSMRTGSGHAAVVPRHRDALEACAGHLDELRSLIEPERCERSLLSPESAATGLRLALDALTPVAGSVHPDDVIGRIFATFCIGK